MVSVHTSSPPTVHTAYTSGGVSVTVPVVSAILWVGVWILETQVGLSLVWKSTWKEKEDTVDCRSRKPSFLNARYLSIVTSHTHCVYKSGALPSANWKNEKPSGTYFACVGTSSPRFLPASDSEWPHHLSQRWRRGQNRAFSQCVYVLRTLTWETSADEKKTPMALHLLLEVSSLPRFQTAGNGSRKSPQAFRHEHESELFLEVLNASDRAVGDAVVRSVSLTNGK